MIRLFPIELWATSEIDWLKAQYLYSFSCYYDPDRMGFGALRVVNHDVIAAGKGFDLHPHSNMEIVTIILEGELRHADTMGNFGVITPGQIQHMSAGTGIQHMEVNSGQTPGRGFQIWIEPDTYHKPPSYRMTELTNLPYEVRNGVTLQRFTLTKDQELIFSSENNSLCILVGYGAIDALDKRLNQGSAIEIDEQSEQLTVTALENSTLFVIAQQRMS